MEAINKDTMWYIVEKQRMSFLENFESELSVWIQERVYEDDWDTMKDIIELVEEQWEKVIPIIYELSEKDGEERSRLLYHNLEIQHYTDKKWMCQICIERVNEAVFEG